MHFLSFFCSICAIFNFVLCYISPPYGYEEKWMDNIPVDHFAYSDNRTFSMRFLINDTFYKIPKINCDLKNAPIFFYCGNEGDITMFAQNSGFMWDIAPQFNALILFAEHRFYGKSMPFGNQSYDGLDNLGKLSTEQALADYANFIRWFKNEFYPSASQSPVVAFGGSYGGMLAAWMRIKYPHIVIGALASSAPILQFTGLTDCEVYSSIVTRTFKNSGDQCDVTVSKSWPIIFDLYSTSEGRHWLNENFHLCNNSLIETWDDVWQFVYWLSAAYGNLAMMDYPYATNFTNPVPGWCVKVACSFLTDPRADNKTLLIGVYQAVSVYMNYTGQTECYSFNSTTTSQIGTQGWDFQTCTEMLMPMCNNGTTDMFEPLPWNYPGYSDQCFANFGVRPRPQWAETEYGGNRLQAASNIIFSNGNLDPWSGGGVTSPLSGSDTLIPIYILQAAHHYDLRGFDQQDTVEILIARSQEINIISQWLGLNSSLSVNHLPYFKRI